MKKFVPAQNYLMRGNDPKLYRWYIRPGTGGCWWQYTMQSDHNLLFIIKIDFSLTLNYKCRNKDAEMESRIIHRRSFQSRLLILEVGLNKHRLQSENIGVKTRRHKNHLRQLLCTRALLGSDHQEAKLKQIESLHDPTLMFRSSFNRLIWIEVI